MKKIWTIACRDFKSFFTSPVAYIVIASFLFIMGWMFFQNLYYFSLQSLRYQNMNFGSAPTITDGIIRPLYGNMNVIFLFAVPLITMRVFAEERKVHTIELLMTAPITITQMILGKFFAALGLILTILILTSVYPITLFVAGNPEFGPVLGAALGTLLLSACYVSVGVLFSAFTENQIVAAILTFATCLFFWLVNWAAQAAGPVWGEVLNYLSLIGHFNNLSRGLIDSSDILYYLSFIGVGLFLTHRVLDSLRWR